MTDAKTPTQQVEEGKKRLEDLNNRRTRATTILETERTRLEQAREEAKAAFGIADLAQLRELRASRHAENAAKAADFDAALDAAETQLAAVEQQLGQV